MVTEDRREASDLSQIVARAPQFDFYQLVRLLRRIAERSMAVAEGPSHWHEHVRFRSNVSFAFMASDVQSVELPSDPEDPATVVVNFLGVATPSSRGSLPTFYSQFLLDEAASREDDGKAAGIPRSRRGNHAPRAFFDLFNDRLIALFYRAWEKNCLPMHYEAGNRRNSSRVLFGLLGFGTSSLAENLGFDVRALLSNAALLLRRPTTAASLAHVLTRVFEVPFAVTPFVRMRVALGDDQKLRLGKSMATLGETTVLGDSALVSQGKFRLHVGPLHWRQFQALLPGNTPAEHPQMLSELISLVRQAVGGEFEFDMQLVLREQAIPSRMLLRGSQPARARLGLSTWLGKRLHGGDAADTICQESMLEGSK